MENYIQISIEIKNKSYINLIFLVFLNCLGNSYLIHIDIHASEGNMCSVE